MAKTKTMPPLPMLLIKHINLTVQRGVAVHWGEWRRCVFVISKTWCGRSSKEVRGGNNYITFGWIKRRNANRLNGQMPLGPSFWLVLAWLSDWLKMSLPWAILLLRNHKSSLKLAKREAKIGRKETALPERFSKPIFWHFWMRMKIIRRMGQERVIQ